MSAMPYGPALTRGWSGHRARTAVWSACLVTLLAACSGPPPPQNLPDLHLPGVAQIGGLTGLQMQGGWVNYIRSVAAYVPSGGAGGTRVLFQLEVRTDVTYNPLYDVGLDGRGLRSVPLQYPCGGAVSISGDAQWAACSDEDGIEVIALAPERADRGRQILTDGSLGYLAHPTWSPDGLHLAVTAIRGEEDCVVAIYSGRPPYAMPRLSALLPLPGFDLPDAALGTQCDFSQLTWSPDGAWLALVARGPPMTVYGLRLPPLPQATPADAPAAVIPGAGDRLVKMATTSDLGPPAWSREGGALGLTVVDATSGSAVRVDVATGRRTTVLMLPSGAGLLCATSWTPDGRRLVFVQCSPGNLEFWPRASKVYVYTLGSG